MVFFLFLNLCDVLINTRNEVDIFWYELFNKINNFDEILAIVDEMINVCS